MVNRHSRIFFKKKQSKLIISDHFKGFDKKIIFDDLRAKKTGEGGLSPPHLFEEKVPFLENLNFLKIVLEQNMFFNKYKSYIFNNINNKFVRF